MKASTKHQLVRRTAVPNALTKTTLEKAQLRQELENTSLAALSATWDKAQARSQNFP